MASSSAKYTFSKKRKRVVEHFLAESWSNLKNKHESSTSSSSQPSAQPEVSVKKADFANGVPKHVSRNPTSIFPAGQPILLPAVPVCSYCKARRFFLEPDGFCCCNGDILLKPVVLPADLINLLTGSSQICKHFRNYIRLYNNNFAYTSMGVKYDSNLASKAQCGIYTFRVSGQIHHYLGDLKSEQSDRLGMQLYFCDPKHELHNRLATSSNLNMDVMNKLMHIMDQNPYAVFLRSLNKVADIDRYYISINCSSSLGHRTHNCLKSNEIAAIWLDDQQGEHCNQFERDIRV